MSAFLPEGKNRGSHGSLPLESQQWAVFMDRTMNLAAQLPLHLQLCRKRRHEQHHMCDDATSAASPMGTSFAQSTS